MLHIQGSSYSTISRHKAAYRIRATCTALSDPRAPAARPARVARDLRMLRKDLQWKTIRHGAPPSGLAGGAAEDDRVRGVERLPVRFLLSQVDAQDMRSFQGPGTVDDRGGQRCGASPQRRIPAAAAVVGDDNEDLSWRGTHAVRPVESGSPV